MQESLRHLLDLDLSEGRLLIMTHDNPDPDSIASAVALALLLREKKGVDSVVGYSGMIGRAENRAMVDILDLKLTHVSALDLAAFRYTALIDAQPFTGNSVTDRIPDIVVDHHPLREQTRQAPFWIVRRDLGASATILTEFLRLAGVSIPEDLATALLYGIRSETQDLGREASETDLHAYQFLFAIADHEKLGEIMRPSLSLRYFTQLAVALDALRVGETVAVCHLRSITNADFVPEMADFAVRMEGIRWALMSGVFNGKLYASIRTNDPHADAGHLIQEVLSGLGSGGGHGMRAGGNVDLDSGARPEAIHEILVDRFLQLTGTSGEKLHDLRSHPRTEIELNAAVR